MARPVPRNNSNVIKLWADGYEVQERLIDGSFVVVQEGVTPDFANPDKEYFSDGTFQVRVYVSPDEPDAINWNALAIFSSSNNALVSIQVDDNSQS